MNSRQWRCIEELERNPAFLERAAQEFPMLAEALAGTQGTRHGRRDILRLFGAALAMGGISACTSGEPSGVLIPAVHIPPGLVPGQPDHYATAHVHAGYALGTVVTHQMDRPIKVEGNSNHPSSLGSTDVFAQAEVLSFYDPAREMQVMGHGVLSDRQNLLTAIVNAREQIAASKGEGLRLLTGTVTSPTLSAQIDRLLQTYPSARWQQWEPFNRDSVLKGSQIAYGRAVDLLPHLDAADVILGIDSDIIDGAPGWVRFARDFASRRNPTHTQKMSRVYAIEAAPTLLGAVADHRFVAGPAAMHEIVGALAASILSGSSASSAPPWLPPLVDDLKAARGRAFIHAGSQQPAEVHAVVHAMNEALGGRGKTYDLIEPVAHQPVLQSESFAELVADMHAGRVTTLLVIDSNPVFTAPGSLGFNEGLQHVGASFALSREPDETSAAVAWSAPMTHSWESWDDARGHDGTATILQPQALPLYGGIAPSEMVALFISGFAPTPLEMVQATWKDRLKPDFANGWRDALASGVVRNTASGKSDVKLRPDAARVALPPAPGGISILFRPDPSLWDGRYANNPWLQELPRSLNKLTWDNPLLVSPAIADRLKVKNGDLVELGVGTGRLTVPVWMQPGQAADVVVAWCGNGRRVAEGAGRAAGFDFYPVTGVAQTATLKKVKGQYDLVSTIHHNLLFPNIDHIVKHATLAEFRARQDFAKEPEEPEIYHRRPQGVAQWAMSVDLNACIGCNACVIACQAENNIPTVGKDQVAREREMHWLRIDRYYEGTATEPHTFFQPMLCMHCEKAPCELVCPVGATVHDSEGLNVMVYNRCIGTRFCSNNCPYKVRRFNFYDFGGEQRRPAVSWNPNVTVRGRGVMEKCTYCLQRIAAARIAADRQNRPVGPQEVRTACQQACPTQAFTFGDKANPDSDVAKRKESPLDYELLEDQHTHPRTTYEALVRNPNPKIAETTV
jgi:MoCo/4Fe-4S cofactor protein with predicted Tat translocation signal